MIFFSLRCVASVMTYIHRVCYYCFSVLQVRGIVDDLVNDFLDFQFPEAVPMMEKDAY